MVLCWTETGVYWLQSYLDFVKIGEGTISKTLTQEKNKSWQS